MSDSANLHPSSGTKQHLTDAFNAFGVINAYAQAMGHIALEPVTTPPSSWFTKFKGQLDSAQAHANIWTDDLGPELVTTVPNMILNYNGTFQPAITYILGITDNWNTTRPPTSGEQQEIVQLVGALVTTITQQRNAIEELAGEAGSTGLYRLNNLKSFSDQLNSDQGALMDGKDSAYKQIETDEKTLSSIETKINELNAKIKEYQKLVEAAELGLGVTIFLGIIGLALAVATGGAAAPIVLGAVGVVGVGGSIAGTVVSDKDINAAYTELHQQQKELKNEERQISALIGIVNTVGNLVEQNESAQAALSAILDGWRTLEDKSNAVLQALQSAEVADLPTIVIELELQTAQTAWNDLQAFSEKWISSFISPSKPIPLTKL